MLPLVVVEASPKRRGRFHSFVRQRSLLYRQSRMLARHSEIHRATINLLGEAPTKGQTPVRLGSIIHEWGNVRKASRR